MNCPICKVKIEEDEIIDILGIDIGSINPEGEVTFSQKQTLIKQRGFGEDSYIPVMVTSQVCPNCGLVFVPNIKEYLKKGVRNDK